MKKSSKKQKKKTKKRDPYLLVCKECGSDNVSMEAWVNVNTNEYVDDMGSDAYTSCEDCRGNEGVVNLKDFEPNEE